MAITRAQVATVEALAEWLQENAVPSIFNSVTFSDSVLTATDADNNVVLQINGGTGTSNTAYFRAFRGSENYLELKGNRLPRDGYIQIIGCDNGVIIDSNMTDSSGYNRRFAALFTKTNSGKTAIIFPSALSATSNAQYTTALNHVAFGYSETIATTPTFTPEAGQQTNFCTFCTNADIEDVSYTPKAFYLPMHSAYNSEIGKFLSGGKVYITNGYWAIDTEQSEDE